jgi:hypothetical protein
MVSQIIIHTMIIAIWSRATTLSGRDGPLNSLSRGKIMLTVIIQMAPTAEYSRKVSGLISKCFT